MQSVSCDRARGRQRKKPHTPRGEISWNQVEIMRNQSRFPWNQAQKSAQSSSPTHFYNVWHHFWGKSRGNQREIRKSRTPKLLVADLSWQRQYIMNCTIELTSERRTWHVFSILFWSIAWSRHLLSVNCRIHTGHTIPKMVVWLRILITSAMWNPQCFNTHCNCPMAIGLATCCHPSWPVICTYM